MKCKVCGAYNEDYLEYCDNCAAPLTPEPVKAEESVQKNPPPSRQASGEGAPAWGFVQAPKWPKPEFDANTVSEDDIPEAYTKRFAPRPVDEVSEGSSQFNDAAVQHAGAAEDDLSITQTRIKANSVSTPAMSNDYDNDDDYEDAPPVMPKKFAEPIRDDYYEYEDSGYKSKRAPRAPRSRGGNRASRKKGTLIAAAAGAVVVILLIVCAILVSANHGGSVSAFISSTFGGNPLTQPPKIEDTTMDGEPAKLITIYAKKNYVVRFTSPSMTKEFTMDKKSLPLRVPVQIWIPDEPLDSNQLTIIPDMTIISPDGKETPIEFEAPIIIDIPTISLSITAPVATTFVSDTLAVLVSGTTSDNTASIFINDVQIAVDEGGNFSSTYTLPGDGTYTVNIEARKNGYQTAREELSITYGVGGDPLNGGTTQGLVVFGINDGVTKRTESATQTITGTMEAGAVITVSGAELEGEVSMDTAAGTFTFVVKTPDVGLYSPVVTATKDGAAATKTLFIEHAPVKETYMSGAHRFDSDGYSRIKESPTHNQGYKVVGTIEEVLQLEPYVVARIKTSVGEVIFSYYSGVSTVEVGDGKTYEVYASPAGTDDATGLPHMHCWYILKRSN